MRPRPAAALLLVPMLLAAAACTDARGFNPYQATCADQHKLAPGTDAFRTCAAQEEADYIDTQRRRRGSPGSP